jgi:tetratricopeptide (TPR) repeat protein
MRASLLLVGCLAFTPLAFAPARVLADDEEPAGPAAPATGPQTIAQEWKKGIKQKNSAYAKERGAYWAEKVKPTDKDSYWLGLIWDKAGEREKAIACFEGYLKVEGGADANREGSMIKIMENQAELQAWDKAIAAGKEMLKSYPASKGAAGTWSSLGRIHRRKGDLDAAVQAFREALALKRATALFDLIDIYLVQGDANKAKAACNEFREVFQKDAVKANFDMLEAFVGRVGGAAPSLEGSARIVEAEEAEPPADPMGGGEPAEPKPAPAPAASLAYGGKPTFLYHVHHGAVRLDGRLSNLRRLRDELDEKARFLGLLSLKKIDAAAQKEDPTLTPEREQAQMKVYLDKFGHGLEALLVSDATFQALGLRWAGQMIVVDREGKLRWMRLNDENGDGYDWYCAAEALKKFGG